MKTIFRKAMTVLGSAVLVGASVGTAAAASYTDSFMGSTAVVTGSNNNALDNAAAAQIAATLNAANAGSTVTTLSGGSGVTETEIPLGGVLNVSRTDLAGSSLTDSKIDGLLDSKISWDDGGPSGSDDYKVYEEIMLGDMSVVTTLDNNDFEDLAAINNDRALEYRYVFDDDFNASAVDSDDSSSEDLYLTILGKSYEIKSMTASSITVVTSEEVSLSPGESITVDGKVFTLDRAFDGKAQVNGEIISESQTETIDGMKVNVDTVAYDSDNMDNSVVILKVGDEISKTYSSGEEYVGEDQEDPQWVWDIANLDSAGGYIGVKYNWKETDENDDVAYIGESYILPENFGEVSLDALTDVDYEDFKVYFDQLDLYNSTTTSSTETVNDAYVMVIEASDGTEDAITTVTGTHETNKIYLRWASYGNRTENGDTVDALELFYSDVDGTVTDAIRPRYAAGYDATTTNNTIGTDPDLADITVGDTTYSVTADVTADLTVTFTNDDTGDYFTVDAGGTALAAGTGDFQWFGGTDETTSKEVGEAGDLNINGTSAGTYDNDVLMYDGTMIEEPQNNLESDEVIFSLPSDRVYATVSVMVGGESSEPETEGGAVTVTDANVPANMDLIVVGGSAVNSVAAELLEGAYSEGAFTTATGVAAGEALIESFARGGNTALLVAGYNAEDTSMATTYLNNNDVDVSVGSKWKVVSESEAVAIEA